MTRRVFGKRYDMVPMDYSFLPISYPVTESPVSNIITLITYVTRKYGGFHLRMNISVYLDTNLIFVLYIACKIIFFKSELVTAETQLIFIFLIFNLLVP